MGDKIISMKWEYKLGLVCDTVQTILSIQRMLVSVQTSRDHIEDLSKHNGVGIFVLMKWSNNLISSRKAKMLVFTRK